ncbi:MAG: heat-inducible transcription repressor HrcA [Firmicutes bacterium]|nr:heat-inducible transcription repressor HrcA [Bacillota bacterium]
MILNDRKIRILEAIVNDYIATAEPIGSRTIAKKYDLGISSATIRNEMSDLEELGLIVQPHTSSGRVPSDKGYRLYVDRLLRCRDLTDEEASFFNDIIMNNIDHIDYLMQQTAKALSLVTNYTTIVSKPKSKKDGIKHIQLVPLDETSVIAVVITDSKAIKNNIIRTEQPIDASQLNGLSDIINNIISTHSFDEIKAFATGVIPKDASGNELFFKEVFAAAVKCVADEEDTQLYTSGVNKMLDFPEFSDVERAKHLFKALEEKDMLIDILGSDNSEPNSVRILIGNENNLEQLKDCSVIKTNYNIGNTEGTIGIIGPTRMDYTQAISVLNGIIKNINRVILALSEKKT